MCSKYIYFVNNWFREKDLRIKLRTETKMREIAKLIRDVYTSPEDAYRMVNLKSIYPNILVRFLEYRQSHFLRFLKHDSQTLRGLKSAREDSNF